MRSFALLCRKRGIGGKGGATYGGKKRHMAHLRHRFGRGAAQKWGRLPVPCACTALAQRHPPQQGRKCENTRRDGDNRRAGWRVLQQRQRKPPKARD